MDKTPISLFSFHGYSVDYISYKINPNFRATSPLDIKMNLEVRTNVNPALNTGNVTLIAKFFKEQKQVDSYPFILDVSLTGKFSLNNISDEEKLRKLIKVNGTTALFPFLRSTVADITRAANVQPLLMPLINVHKLLEQQEQNELNKDEEKI